MTNVEESTKSLNETLQQVVAGSEFDNSLSISYRVWKHCCGKVGDRVTAGSIARDIGLADPNGISACLSRMVVEKRAEVVEVTNNEHGRRVYRWLILPSVKDMHVRETKPAAHTKVRGQQSGHKRLPLTETPAVITSRLLADLAKLEKLATRDLSGYSDSELIAELHRRRQS